jgi:ferric-dicitrate binding protein FerR (iron transport regulator)
MIDCDKCRDYVEQCLEGVISEQAFEELKTHVGQCPSCRQEFEQFELLQEVVRDAFASSTEPAVAKEKVLAGLAERPDVPRERVAPWAVALANRRQMAMAASILIGIGLIFGFAMGKVSSDRMPGERLAAIVPMEVADLEGTVLVRHADCDIWHALKQDSSVHLGDTFHSTAQAGFALTMEDESRIEVNQNSMLTLAMYNGQTQFFLEHGECTAALESPHPPFFIKTPHGRLEALGTEFTVTVTDQ